MICNFEAMEEERRVCGGRKKRWRDSEERDTEKGEWKQERIKNKKVMWTQNKKLFFF